MKNALGGAGRARAVNDIERIIQGDRGRACLRVDIAQPGRKVQAHSRAVAIERYTLIAPERIELVGNAFKQLDVLLGNKQEAGSAVIQHQCQAAATRHA